MHFIELHLTNNEMTLVNMDHVYEIRGNKHGGSTLYTVAPSDDSVDTIQVIETPETLKNYFSARRILHNDQA